MSQYPSDESTARVRLAWRVGGSAALCVAGAAWWLLLGQATVAARTSLTNQLKELDELCASETEIRARCHAMNAEFKQWDAQAQLLAARISEVHDESAFLDWVTKRSGSTGLELRDFRPMGYEAQGEFDGRSVALLMQGSYENLCRFLDQLRDYPRLNRLVRLEVVPRDTSGESFNCTLQITLYSQAAASKSGVRPAVASSQG